MNIRNVTDVLLTQRRKILNILQDRTIYQRNKSLIAVILIGFATFCITFLSTKLGFLPALILMILIAGTLVVLLCFMYERLAFYAALASPFILFTADRLIPQELPIGIIQHLLVFLMVVVMLVKKLSANDRSFQFMRNPVTLVYLIVFVYLILQVANPNVESIVGWLRSLRFATALLLTYIVALYLFKSLSFLDHLFNLLVILCTLTALYAIKQKFFGYADFELRWIYAHPMTLKRIFIWGQFRIFSLLSDPAAFGLFMSATSISTFIIAFNKKGIIRVLFIVASILMLISMSYSGTRTAYAMVIAGASIYILMRITKIQTLLVLGGLILAFCIIMFGPFYGGTINRVRSTFDSDDGSLGVRDINRHYIQPYIHAHPMGGGPLTTGPQGIQYHPNHFLAGFPSDNGYLKIALEQGYIGLILHMVLFFVSLRIGVKNYYRAKNPKVRNYLLAIITFLFSILLGLYAQPAIGQIPLATVFWSFLGYTAKIMEYDEDPTLVESGSH